MALQKASQYMEYSCLCDVVRVVNVHDELVATFEMKGNMSKVVAKQTDVLNFLACGRRRDQQSTAFVFLWFPLPAFPSSLHDA